MLSEGGQHVTSYKISEKPLPEAISVIRNMLGPTNGRQAAPGTIRGDFGLSRQMNLVHGSDGPEAAAREIALYFKPEELVAHTATLDPWNASDDDTHAVTRQLFETLVGYEPAGCGVVPRRATSCSTP